MVTNYHRDNLRRVRVWWTRIDWFSVLARVVTWIAVGVWIVVAYSIGAYFD